MSDAQANKPNILIIMADQMTAALSGAYDHPVVKTPNLDKLCAEGVRFDSAYTNCPVCAPARAAMLSGRHVSRTRSYDNAGCLPSDVPCFPHYLRLAGYETAGSGKMHFIGADQLHGFEQRLTTDIYPADFSWTTDYDHMREAIAQKERGEWPEQPKWGKWVQMPLAEVCDFSWQMGYDEEAHFRALEFIREHRPGGPGVPFSKPDESQQPFCLMVSFSHPHTPYSGPREFWDLYDDEDIAMPNVPEDPEALHSQMDAWQHVLEGVPENVYTDVEMMKRVRRAYYAMVSWLDAKVGALMDELERLGMRDNTAILFTADHGDMLGERGFVEKRVFYEWSARIPFIASWPGHWREGETCAEPVSLIDILPTLTELTGAPEPIGIDGRSFLPILEGRADSGERVAISEMHSEGVLAPCFMVRKGKYKYIHIHGHDGRLLDLEADPEELHDLYHEPAMKEVVASMRRELESRFDIEAIAADVVRAQKEHGLIRDAMRTGRRTSWDHVPVYTGAEKWLRK